MSGWNSRSGGRDRLDQDGVAVRAHARAERGRRVALGNLRALHQMDRAEAVEVREAARVVQRRLVGDERDVEVRSEPAHQFGDAAAAAVARREHGERRDDEHARPRARACVRRAQPKAVRRTRDRDGCARRFGQPRRRGWLRRAARARADGQTRRPPAAATRARAGSHRAGRTRAPSTTARRSRKCRGARRTAAGCARRCARSLPRNGSGRSSRGARASRASADRRGRTGRRARRAAPIRRPPSRTGRSSGSRPA